MSRCRSCDAEIIWATTPGGHAIPIDAAPSPNGNVDLSGDAYYGQKLVATVLAGLFLDDARSSGRELYMPHHATCPHGRAWRKKK